MCFSWLRTMRVLAEESGRLSAIGEMVLPEKILPDGVRQVIQRRLQKVPQHFLPLLKAAAVDGRQLDMVVLEALSKELDATTWLDIEY